MISYIIGTVAGIEENSIVLENGGIGYRIFMPGPSAYALTPGSEVKVYTYMAVREDDVSLFGFTSAPDLEMFRMLLTVNGVGPKAALGILSSIETDELKMAIAAEDPKLISGAKGVGAKTAQKIILELKGKISKDVLSGAGADGLLKAAVQPKAHSAAAEAVEVLEALGFSRSESTEALSQVVGAEDMDSSQLVSAALKLID